jgi:GMP synthase-like glutamine amidotransferase
MTITTYDITKVKEMEMRVHVLQHVPFEGLGSMATWLTEARAVVSYTRFYNNEVLPSLNGINLIIVMGGPMSVNDESALAWLKDEKRFVREAVVKGVPLLGVCLGAQLIANALGSRIYRNAEKEIGWFPIEATPAIPGVFRFPEKSTVFHWHGETFDLPSGAVRLAKSAGCENQAFQIGQNVIGLQFHLETTPQSARSILDNCGHKLTPGPYVQSEAELRGVDSAAYVGINHLMSEVLSYLTRNRS